MGSNAGSSSSSSSSRVVLHQLSNGLYVSGAPDQYKERSLTMTSTAMPYTGGDIRKSGELGKMFDIPVIAKKSGPINSAHLASTRPSFSSNSSPLNSAGAPRTTLSSNYSGPLPRGAYLSTNPRNSGPIDTSHLASMRPAFSSTSGPLNSAGAPRTSLPRNYSGPLPRGVNPPANPRNSGPLAPSLPATGLITSGPLSSSGHAPRKLSGPIEGSPSVPSLAHHKQAINVLRHHDGCQAYSFWGSFPKLLLWVGVPIFGIGFIAGGFILGVVGNAILLVAIAALFSMVLLLLLWNSLLGKKAITGFVTRYPEVGLNRAKDGQYVKLTGIVTCGSVPLESSHQRVKRCVYTSTALYEYRGFGDEQANPKHRLFTWGLRFLERRAVDFYISDFQSGLRALVKAGYGGNVTPYVEEATVVNTMKKNMELNGSFIHWLSERNLSTNNRVMKLKEGYIKEGSTVTVMGVIQRHENVLMIVPPPEAVSTGCQLCNLILPVNIEGLILTCEDTSKPNLIPI